MISAYDKWLTTEPDNGFVKWKDSVWSLIGEDEISMDDYENNEQFFDDGIMKLSLIGSNGFCTPEFAASVLKMRFRFLKNNPDCKTWDQVQEKINKFGY